MIQTIRKAAGDAVGEPWQAVQAAARPPLNVQSNRLYDAHVSGRHLIVKEYLKPDEFDVAPVREFEGLRLLATLDIAPQPLLLRPQNGRTAPLVVYEYMPGEMWDRRRPTAAQLQQLAELWLQTNEVWREDLWLSRGYEVSLAQKMDRFEQQFQEYAAWARQSFAPGEHAARLCLSTLQWRHSIVRELSAMPVPLSFCRADARFANVILRPDGRLGLVDWEDCGLRDAALDLADLLTAPNQEDLLSWSDWQPFLHTYLGQSLAQDATITRRMRLYLALFPLAWLALLLNAGVARARAQQLAGWRIHEGLPNERLRRYLARARAWPATNLDPELQALAEVQFFPQNEQLPPT